MNINSDSSIVYGTSFKNNVKNSTARFGLCERVVSVNEDVNLCILY